MKPNRHSSPHSLSFRGHTTGPGSAPRRSRPARHASCIALIDDRFVSWLMHRDCEPGFEPEVSRRALHRVLGRVSAGAGLELSFRRFYWYTDRPDGSLIDEQVVRTAGEGDETWAMIERDLRSISQWQSCETVLLACDDERLLAAIDDAQLRGVNVVMLADEGVLDYSLLREEDPEWALLLAQADRRLVARADDLSELRPAPNGGDHATQHTGGDELQTALEEVVRNWWGAQSNEAREELRAALALNTGIPQEVDRELLLQSRERFVRPLSFIEKKQMRSCLRGIAGGGTPDGAGSMAGYA